VIERSDLDLRPPHDDRWQDIARLHAPEEVARLAGTLRIEHTLSARGAERLWDLLRRGDCLVAPGTGSPDEALQLVRAGCSTLLAAPEGLQQAPWSARGWCETSVVARLQRALVDADRAAHLAGNRAVRWLAPIVSDVSVSNCAPLEVVEAVRARIEAGAAAVRIDDRAGCSSGGIDGRLAITSTKGFVGSIAAARLSADVEGVPLLLVASSAAGRATHLTSDHDERDRAHVAGERDEHGMFPVRGGLEFAVQRALAAAPLVEIVCLQAERPSLEEAARFAAAVRARHPGRILAYEVPAEVHWARHVPDEDLDGWQRELAKLGYSLQFLPRATFHSRNAAAFELGTQLRLQGLGGWSGLRDRELAHEDKGYGVARERRDGADSWARAARAAVKRT
jgi:isocitrate lyase